MYQKRIIIFLTLIVVVIVNACKKEPSSEGSEIDPLTINDVKDWLKTNKPQLIVANLDKAQILTGQDGSNIIRIQGNDTLVNGRWILTDLLFQKDSVGHLNQFAYKLVIDTGYFSKKKVYKNAVLNKRKLIRNDDFTGKILLFSINNRIIKGREYRSGKLVYNLEPQVKNHGLITLMSEAPPSSDMSDSPFVWDDLGSGNPLNQVDIVGTPPSSIPAWTGSPGWGTDFPIGTGTSGTPGVTSPSGEGWKATETSTTISVSLDDRLAYPTLAKILDGLYEKVKNDAKLMNALVTFTHLTEAQILQYMKSNQGPLVRVVSRYSMTGGAAAEFNHESGLIFLSDEVAKNANYFTTQYPTATEFYLTVTILHEFVHWGENNTQIFTQHAGNLDDAGFQFENSYYGGKVNLIPATGVITLTPL
jgi:hypothetical protein